MQTRPHWAGLRKGKPFFKHPPELSKQATLLSVDARIAVNWEQRLDSDDGTDFLQITACAALIDVEGVPPPAGFMEWSLIHSAAAYLGN